MARGDDLDWDDDDLERLTDPNFLQSNQENADLYWRENSPPGYENLLDAKPLLPGSDDEVVPGSERVNNND